MAPALAAAVQRRMQRPEPNLQGVGAVGRVREQPGVHGGRSQHAGGMCQGLQEVQGLGHAAVTGTLIETHAPTSSTETPMSKTHAQKEEKRALL